MSLSISSLKDQLGRLGIDTSTPGLSGDERLKELNLRLMLAQNRSKMNSREAQSSEDHDGEALATGWDIPSLNHLSMSELRSRLETLGIETATPGKAGDERRQELIRKLVDSICGGQGNEDDASTSIIDQMIDNNTLMVSLFRSWLPRESQQP
jgi:hypothetical protein